MAATDAAKRFQDGAVLLDVREDFELALAKVEGALHVPMRQLAARVAEVPKDWDVLVLCHSGGRSQTVANWLIKQGYRNVWNVAGGIDAWADEVDDSIPHY